MLEEVMSIASQSELERELKDTGGLIDWILSEKAVQDLYSVLQNLDNISQYGPAGAKNLCMISNSSCSVAGRILCGIAAQNYFLTKDRVARFLYGTSMVCSGAAVIAGGFEAFGNKCRLSPLAVGGDVGGGAFLFLANRSRQIAETRKAQLQGQQGWQKFRPQNWTRRRAQINPNFGKGVGFVTTPNVDIGTDDILMIFGAICTIYSSGKLIIKIYHSNRLIHNFVLL